VLLIWKGTTTIPQISVGIWEFWSFPVEFLDSTCSEWGNKK